MPDPLILNRASSKGPPPRQSPLAAVWTGMTALAKRLAAIEARPLPKDGRDGRDGANGVGIADALVDADGVLALTLENGRVVRLSRVVGRDGAQGERGHDGATGVGIAAVSASEIGDVSVSLTDGQVLSLGNLRGERGAPGKDGIGVEGKPGRDGVDGKDGAGIEGKAGRDGANGNDGRGIAALSLTPEGDLSATLTDGQVFALGNVRGPRGENGRDGKDARPAVDGKDGANGRDGVGIASFVVDERGHGIASFSDGRTQDIGLIRGADGKDGRDAPEPKNGVDGRDGRDGIAGRSVVRADLRDGVLSLTYTDGVVEQVGSVIGPAGADGSDGTGILSVGLTDAGELAISLTDGQTLNLGRVRGADGKDGRDGVDGKDGKSIAGQRGLQGEQGPPGTLVEASASAPANLIPMDLDRIRVVDLTVGDETIRVLTLD